MPRPPGNPRACPASRPQKQDPTARNFSQGKVRARETAWGKHLPCTQVPSSAPHTVPEVPPGAVPEHRTRSQAHALAPKSTKQTPRAKPVDVQESIRSQTVTEDLVPLSCLSGLWADVSSEIHTGKTTQPKLPYYGGTEPSRWQVGVQCDFLDHRIPGFHIPKLLGQDPVQGPEHSVWGRPCWGLRATMVIFRAREPHSTRGLIASPTCKASIFRPVLPL